MQSEANKLKMQRHISRKQTDLTVHDHSEDLLHHLYQDNDLRRKSPGDVDVFERTIPKVPRWGEEPA